MVDQNSEELFQKCRPMLRSLAARMLGSLGDGDDIVQEAYLRWIRTDSAQIRAPEAFLATVVTRLCLNHLNLARVRAAQATDHLDPETLVAETPDPVEQAELADALSQAFVRMIERLSPTERAVFLLREAFELDYSEIANVVQRSEENCRQILRRARERVAGGQVKTLPTVATLERDQRLFLHAARTGELGELLNLLSAEAILVRDAGDLSRPTPPALRGVALREELRRRLGGLGAWTPLPLMIPGAATKVRWVAAHTPHSNFAVLFKLEDGQIDRIQVITCPTLLREVKALAPCPDALTDN